MGGFSIYTLSVEVMLMLEKYIPGKRKEQGTPSGGVSELLLVGAFGFIVSVFRPELFADYNGPMRYIFAGLVFVGIYRSDRKTGG